MATECGDSKWRVKHKFIALKQNLIPWSSSARNTVVLVRIIPPLVSVSSDVTNASL